MKGDRAALEEQVASQKDKLKKAAARLRSLKEVRKGKGRAPRGWECFPGTIVVIAARVVVVVVDDIVVDVTGAGFVCL